MKIDELIQKQLEKLSEALETVSEEDFVVTDKPERAHLKPNSPSYIEYRKPNMEICARYFDEMSTRKSWRDAMRALFKETLLTVHLETPDGKVLLHLESSQKNFIDELMTKVSPAVAMWAAFTILASVAKVIPFVGVTTTTEGLTPTQEIPLE